jgi:heme oxygenase (mycobilin-producing)
MASFTLDFDKHPRIRFRIDSFSVPGTIRTEFEAAMRRNLEFIQTLPGFVGHLVFEKTSGPSNFNIVTIAGWESPEALEAAIVAVREYYGRIGFNPASATEKWGVAAEIGQYDIYGTR